jgi:MOSC domain-containing protein YiiM
MSTVEAIYLIPARGAPPQRVAAAQARAGRGLDGDYNQRQPQLFPDPKPEEQLTLVEAEALEHAASSGAPLPPGGSRRNIVTRGVDLNALVGRTFRVGAATARGLEPCHPCAHLEKLTGRPVLAALKGRGGLRAELLGDGEIREGDALVVLDLSGAPG